MQCSCHCDFHGVIIFSVWRCYHFRLQSARITPKGFSCSHILHSPGRSWNKDGCNLKLRIGAQYSPLGPANLCAPAFHSARPRCAFFSAYCSSLISWVNWLMIVHQHLATEHVSQLSGIQGGSSWINRLYGKKTAHLRQKQMHSIPVLFLNIFLRRTENMATKIDKICALSLMDIMET